MRPTTPASARFCDGLSAAGVMVSTTGHVDDAAVSVALLGLELDERLALRPPSGSPRRSQSLADGERAARPGRRRRPSTVPVPAVDRVRVLDLEPGRAVTANPVIGSSRSFGTSNVIDSELSLGRYAGVATTCAAARARERRERATDRDGER